MRLAALHLLLALLLACRCSPSAGLPRRRAGAGFGARHRQQGLRLHDFVIVASTREDRLPLIHASRSLRVGIRTFITVGSLELAEELQHSQDARDHAETYAFYPDRETGSRRWENRYVASPFLAHQYYGNTYKWMLIGDDDTLWFITGLKRLLLRFDHTLPYFISDNLVDYLFKPQSFLTHASNLFMGVQPGLVEHFLRPSWLGTTCLPCHAVQADARLKEKFRRTPLENHQWLGCPCINLQGCQYRRHMCAYQSIADKHFCSGKWDPSRGGLCTFSWPWGGTGMVFSQGLLSRVTWKDSMKDIVEDYLSLPSFDHHAGDWMMALILYDLKDKATQEFPGIGITIPPYSAVMKGEVLHSDHIVFGPITHRLKSMAQDPASWLRNSSSCDTDCMWLLRHVVSHHASVHGDYGGSVAAAAQGIESISLSHREAMQQLGEPAEHLAPVSQPHSPHQLLRQQQQHTKTSAVIPWR